MDNWELAEVESGCPVSDAVVSRVDRFTGRRTLSGMDTPAAIQSGFSDELYRLLCQYDERIGQEFWKLSEREAELGHQAARTVFAPVHLERPGGRLTGISDIPLSSSKHQPAGPVQACPIRHSARTPRPGTTMFPVWAVRPRQAHAASSRRKQSSGCSERPTTRSTRSVIAAWVDQGQPWLERHPPPSGSARTVMTRRRSPQHNELQPD